MANTYLTRTVATTGDRTKATLSVWVKKCSNAEQFIFYNYESNTTNFRIRFNPEALQVETLSGSSVVGTLTTTRKFRDVGAFYHIVVAIDSTLATADDRMKIYVNGVQETAFDARTNPPQNQNMAFNESGHIQYIGSQVTSNYFNGCMSYYYWIDGIAYPASTFGSTDSTTGEWEINTSPSVTMGTNGFTILKDGNTITDQSSNSNNFTLGGGTLTKTEDSPSNGFCTMNPLDDFYTEHTFTNGNTTVIAPSSGYSGVIGAMGASTGKYYFEFKPISKTGDGNEYIVGIVAQPVVSVNQPQSKMPTGYMYLGSNGYKYNDDTGTSYGDTFAAGDIIGVAMDLDNLKIYFSKNGAWQNSGNPESGSTGTGAAFTLTAPSSTEIGFYLPCCSFFSNSAGATMAFNFGNGYFQTTAVSSAGTNASGNGIFEYDTPTGYTALSTKGLNL